MRWVNQQPPEKRSPHAWQGSEGLRTKSEQPQYTPHRGTPQHKRLTFEQAVAMAACLASQALPHMDKPAVVVAQAMSWALPGKVVA